VPVRFLCLEGSPTHENLAKHPNIQVIPLDFKPRNFLDFKLRVELKRILSEGVNLIHVHQPSFLASIIPWVWRQKNLVVIATRHILNDHNKRDPVHAGLYRRLDAFFVMSEMLKGNILATHAIKERQVKVVPYGLDFSDFKPSDDPGEAEKRDAQREIWGANPETVVIGLVGRIDPAKGQATLVRAAAGLLKNEEDYERDIKFVIVGEETRGANSHYLDDLKKLVQAYRLEDRVVFTGFQENIPEVMRALDVFVMPSRQEAFGMVAIEAMAMECPVIISSGGSAEEIVGKDEFGLLVRPDDAFDLQLKIRYLLDRPNLRVEMGRRGREHVVTHYTQDERVRLTLEYYEWCLRRRGL